MYFVIQISILFWFYFRWRSHVVIIVVYLSEMIICFLYLTFCWKMSVSRLIFPAVHFTREIRACKLCFMHDGVACDPLLEIVRPTRRFRDGSKNTWVIPLQFNCCGIYGDNDYNDTAWWRDGQISGNRRQVPLTCCVLKNSEVSYAIKFIVRITLDKFLEKKLFI